MKTSTTLLAIFTLIWIGASSFSPSESEYSCSITFIQENGDTIIKDYDDFQKFVETDWESTISDISFADEKELTLKSALLVLSPRKGDAILIKVESNASLVQQLNKIRNNPGIKVGDRIIIDKIQFKRTKKGEKESPLILTTRE